jgi:23S rRNA pseudouridine2605 synthase
MPRDNDKNNDSRGRRDRPSGGKGRSGAARGPEKKFAKRDFAGKGDSDKGRYAGKSDGPRPYGKKTYSGSGKPYAGKREGASPRRDYDDAPRRFDKDAPRPRGDRPFADRPPRRDRDDARPAARFSDKKFGDKKPYAPRDRGGEKRPYTPRGDRPYSARPPRDGDRPERKFGGDKKFSRDAPDRGPRKDFGSRDRDRKSDPGDRGDSKPWQKRDAGSPDHVGRNSRSSRDGARNFDRPRRDNEDDSKVFPKRPAFGGRGAYRERTPDERRPARPPRQKKSGERIAKVVSRAGLASRRDAEEWIVQGRVTVNGRVINSPALDVTANDVITVDGKPLPPRERTRLFLFHKPRGLMTTHADPEGRPTVFDNLPEGLPRLISIGRLDFNTEGLLLLTNDGGLARALELPETGWLRRYRVRAHGEVTQAQLDELKRGVEVDGVKYGPIDATLERDQGANVWLVFAIREGKNREVRNVMAHLGLEVNRLIRVSYGPFQLAELAEGEVEEVKTRVLRDQLGEKIAALAGADFNRPMPGEPQAAPESVETDTPRGKKPFKPAGKSGLIADRKGRRVLVQRTGSEEARARNEAEANGYGPPRRPQRGYHGKRDLKPRDE